MTDEPKKIICVDDEPSVLRALRRLFMDEADYDVELIGDGAEALERLKGCSPALIISDYRMPGMNGVEFLKEAKHIRPDALRIILSGYADASVIVSLINDGEIYKFIPKPWDDTEMLVTVRRAIEQQELTWENRRLAEKILEQNKMLQEMNDELEQRVEERTRELKFKNQALEIAHNILDQISIGIIGAGDDSQLVYVNQSACTALNLQPHQLLFHPASEVLPAWIINRMKAVVVQDEQEWQEAAPPPDPNRLICTPLKHAGQTAGTIIQILPLSEVGKCEEDER